jgi:catechol 2,3-dioxygenase-like lactoylglutathione lyase family enzyme
LTAGVRAVAEEVDMTGEILGLHHIKIPVSDLPRSRAWYERVFDLDPLTEFRDDDDGVVRGVLYRSQGDLMLSLREHPLAAQGFAGFDPFAILLRGRSDIDHWVARLDDLGVAHSAVVEASIGYILMFDDPDGLQLRFYTLNEQGADPEGRVRYAPA